jgi:hypothetical protein
MFVRGGLPLSWIWLIAAALFVYVWPHSGAQTQIWASNAQAGHPLLWAGAGLLALSVLAGAPRSFDEVKAGSCVAAFTFAPVTFLVLVAGGLVV